MTSVEPGGGGIGRAVTVLGAGIVGISTAIHLQRRGFAVTLLDRGPPGGATSFGNAGVISRGSILPIARPGMRRKAWRYLTNRDPAVRVDPKMLPAMADWLVRFLARADEDHARRATAAINALCARALDAHLDLAREAGATDLVRNNGFLSVYRTPQSLEAAAFERASLSEHGVAHEILTTADLQELEPHLAPIFHAGMLVTGSGSVSDPGALCAAYHRLFEARGGRTLAAEARAIRFWDGRWIVQTGRGEVVGEALAVTLGPWSMDLLRPLGLRLPLAVERGYHTHRRPKGNAFLSRPVHDVDGAYVMAPMQAGTRITTGTELARRDAPSTPRQLARVLPSAHQAFPLVEESLDPNGFWRGARPSFPDSLPVIGPVSAHPGLWLGFGHGHVGLSLGPITGRLLAEAMAGETPAVDLAPYAPDRWS